MFFLVFSFFLIFCPPPRGSTTERGEGDNSCRPVFLTFLMIMGRAQGDFHAVSVLAREPATVIDSAKGWDGTLRRCADSGGFFIHTFVERPRFVLRADEMLMGT